MSTLDYQTEFITFQNELKSFLYRLVTNRQDTEDLAQETYIRTFRSIDTFEGRSSFKTWVFTIAVNLAKNFLKDQARWQEDYQENCRKATYASREIQQTMMDISTNSPHGAYVIKEHIDYCFTCMSKTLLLEEQVCLMLKEVYQFKVKDIMEITGLTEGQVKYNLSTSRDRMQRIFDHKCSLISKTGACHQCTELNGMFNPKQDAVQEALKVKMVREKDKANFNRLYELRLQLVSSIDPLNADGFDFHNYMLEHLPEHSQPV